MPLVTVCGRPCTGKTALATRLRNHLVDAGHAVVLVNEESLGLDKVSGYANAAAEKQTRAAIKAAVDRSLTSTTVVICDSLNYIKGFRYELYCLAKSQRTPHCCVHLDFGVEKAALWNRNRATAAAAGEGAPSAAAPGDDSGSSAAAASGAGASATTVPDKGAPTPSGTTVQTSYDSSMLEELSMRFEIPIETNRWDSPLFRVADEAVSDPYSHRLDTAADAASDGAGDGGPSARGVAVSSFTPAGAPVVSGGTSFTAAATSSGGGVASAGNSAGAGADGSAAAGSSFASASAAAAPAAKPTPVASSFAPAARPVAPPAPPASDTSTRATPPAATVTAGEKSEAGEAASGGSSGDGIPADLAAALDAFPYTALEKALFEAGPIAPNVATVSQRLSDTNFLHHLDQRTQAMVDALVTAQAAAVVGDRLSLPYSKTPLLLLRKTPLAELRRLRRQFIKIARANPPPNAEAIGNVFCLYLNTALAEG